MISDNTSSSAIAERPRCGGGALAKYKRENRASNIALSYSVDVDESPFLPRCMECRRGLAMRIPSVRQSVCPSVRLSVKFVNCDKTAERYV